MLLPKPNRQIPPKKKGATDIPKYKITWKVNDSMRINRTRYSNKMYVCIVCGEEGFHRSSFHYSLTVHTHRQCIVNIIAYQTKPIQPYVICMLEHSV